MNEDKRHSGHQVPEHHNTYLTEDQIREMKRMEGFGWQLKFIRRPLFKPAIVVLCSSDNDSVGVLEEDGTLNMEPDMEIR